MVNDPKLNINPTFDGERHRLTARDLGAVLAYFLVSL